ncbi:unnamed protein product [Rotaria socialis]|uniref:F-box domain-containing protein n=2 Tax=Rotaria socialis TaxID=392032 RepID=A0A819Y0C7_9BILA|nr:unnamed protein product [Rotaria socialis]CAF4147430.1 unnamed protein product [Rotaria socialis]CAF4197406.1 unnamed protein product [Rotaria socialis]
MNQMKLESLSNDLLLDLFELLDVVNLLRAFSGLNARFNSLLYDVRSYRVDLRSISKEDFNIFCSTYLHLISNRTIYVRLSDDEDTPFQCSQLQSVDLGFQLFENLRSLTFNSVSSDHSIDKHFFIKCCKSNHLTHLKFVGCKLFHIKIEDFQDAIDHIWSLPKLSHLYWDFWFECGRHFRIPTPISTSLKCLTICKNDCYSYDFPCLLEKIPCLQKFSMSSDSYDDDDIPLSHKFIPSPLNLNITKLTLLSVRSLRVMTALFQLLPSITRLKIEVYYITLDGHQWKEMIVNYLPQLKYFQFKINFNFGLSINDSTNEEKVDQYLSTYRTPFWIEHRQWFIRCHWVVSRTYLDMFIYSLPYAFDCFHLSDDVSNYHTKSTCSSDMYYCYDSVRYIGYNPLLLNKESFSYMQLINIEQLSLEFPIDQHFFSIILNLENLLALNVTITKENDQWQLQTLLDRASRLFSLSFSSSILAAMPPYPYTSSSMRRLDLECSDPLRRHHSYDKKQCMELIQSPLGIQCRILVIKVEHHVSILELIYGMENLRTLHVSDDNDKRSNPNDLVEVLKHYLPSNWTITRLGYGHIIIQS